MLTESQMLKRFGIDCYWESEIELFHKPKAKKSLLDAIHEAQEKLKQFDAGTLPKEAECRDAIILPLLANSVNITSWGDADLLIKKEYAHTFEDGSRATKRPDIVFFKPPVKLVDFIRATDPTLVYKRDNYYPILNDYTQYCKTFSRVRSSSTIIVEAKRPSVEFPVQSNIAQLKGYVASLNGKEALLTNGKKWLWWDDIVNKESSFETFDIWKDDQMVTLLEKFRSSFFKGSETLELDKLNPRLSWRMRGFLEESIYQIAGVIKGGFGNEVGYTDYLVTLNVFENYKPRPSWGDFCPSWDSGKVSIHHVDLKPSIDLLRLGTFFNASDVWTRDTDSWSDPKKGNEYIKGMLQCDYPKYTSGTNPEGIFSYIPKCDPFYQAVISFWEKETQQKLTILQAKAVVHHFLSDFYFKENFDMGEKSLFDRFDRNHYEPFEDISGYDFYYPHFVRGSGGDNFLQ